MFGSMEIWAASSSPETVNAIVPTVVFPFVLLGAILSSIATAIAGLFGVDWKTEAPRKLLLWILRPKILLTALLLNALAFGGIHAYRRLSDRSRPLWWVQRMNGEPLATDRAYIDTWNANPRVAARSFAPYDRISVAWETRLPAGSFRGVTVSGESAFIGSEDGFVYELDRRGGSVVRKFYVGRAVTPLPLIWNGTLFAGEGVHTTRHARVYAFDLRSGRLRGTVQTRGHTEGDLVLAVHAGRAVLFVAAGQDGLYAVDAGSLKVLWHAPISHFDGGVLVTGGRVFAATGAEKGSGPSTSSLFALSVSTGEIIWKSDLAASAWSRPILFDGAICVGVGEIYLKGNYGQLACHRASDGKSVKAINFEGPLLNSAVPVGGGVKTRLVLTDLRGHVCSVEPDHSAPIWCADLGTKKPVYASSAIAGNRVFVPTEAALRVLDLETGRTIADWTPENGAAWTAAYAGLTVTEDEAYLVDRSGTVRKLVAE